MHFHLPHYIRDREYNETDILNVVKQKGLAPIVIILVVAASLEPAVFPAIDEDDNISVYNMRYEIVSS